MAKNSLPFSVSRPVIGGVPQAVLTAKDDPNMPLLLILHGGPGEPMTPFYAALRPLMDRFVVCLWEQRGAGMSYSKAIRPESLTVSQYVSDTVEVTKHLLARFNREKLVLMGFSWGTLLGILSAAKAPELYAAYVGVGQIADQKASEKDAYDFALKRAKQANDQKSVQTLEEIGPPPYKGPNAMKLMMKERTILRKHSGGTKDVKLTEYFKTILSCPYYSFSDKINYFRGMKLGVTLFKDVLTSTALDDLTAVSVPVYVIQGEHDMQTMPRHAKKLVDRIEAPKKQFILMENAGHSPLEQDAGRFAQVLDGLEGLFEPWTKG